MKVSEAVKAKYVFDELTLGEVLDLVWHKVQVIVVHQDDLQWEYVYFDRDGELNLYDGSEKEDDGVALWTFRLKEKVSVKGNMLYFKKQSLSRHGTAIELLKTSNIDVTKMLQKV
jgi:hypothetical protein